MMGGRARLAAASLIDACRCDTLLYSSEVQQQPRVLADRRGRLRTVRGLLCCSDPDQARFGL